MSGLSYKLSDLAKHIGAEYQGEADCQITGVLSFLESLQTVEPGKLTFLADRKLRRRLPETQAAVVVLSADDVENCPTNSLIVQDPKLAFARLLSLFDESKAHQPPAGIHPTAVIADDALIDETAVIGPYCVIESGAEIGARTRVDAQTVVAAGSRIGTDCWLHPRVTLYPAMQLGDRVILHSGVIIGADGFGLVRDQNVWVKIPQIGRVIIGHDVEVGANTTIDRGALGDTVLGDGVKIDNQVQIGHNVRIGDHSIIAACTGIAGSTVIGQHCMLGGDCALGDHLQLADGVVLIASTRLTKSITKPGYYFSTIVFGLLPWVQYRKLSARLRQFSRWFKSVKKTEGMHDD